MYDPLPRMLDRMFELAGINASDVRLRWRVEDALRAEFGSKRYYFRKHSRPRECPQSTRHEPDE
jgi:hypothetical protein